MAQIARMRCAWVGGGVVGPGLSTFYSTTTTTGFPAAIRAFFEAVKSQLHTGTTITVPNSGDLITVETGELAGTWSESSGGGVTTTSGAGMFVQGVGARVAWTTDGINAGRRVRGSTFLVPMDGDTYDTTGLFLSGAVAILQAAADGLAGSGVDLQIYSPPKTHRDALGNRVIDRDGQTQNLLSGNVPQSISWLRSRRT